VIKGVSTTTNNNTNTNTTTTNNSTDGNNASPITYAQLPIMAVPYLRIIHILHVLFLM